MGADASTRPYFVVEWSGGGGLGHYAYLLAEALTIEGVPATLVTRKGHDLAGAPAPPAERLLWPAAPSLPPGLRRKVRVGLGRLRGWFRVTRLMFRERAAHPVIHLQSIDQMPEVLFGGLCRGMGARVIVTAHNMRPHDAGRLQALVQRIGLRIPHAVIVHTPQAAEEIGRWMAPKVRIHVLGHPSNRRLVELVGRPTPPPNTIPRVSAIGMIRPYKGLEFVVQTFRRLHGEGRPCELRVAGRASDPASVEALLAQVPRDSVSWRLAYLSLPDFIDEVLASDVLLLGHRSLSESGIAQLALGAGVPVVGPRVGALARLLGGRPEWLYEPGDEADATDRLRAVLDRALSDKAALAEEARDLSDAAPSWAAMARECEAIVAELTERAR